jgi:hypothetical protein
MRTLSRYDDHDARASRSREAFVVNVSPFTARFEIGTTPGNDPRFYTLKPGEGVHVQHGYAHEFLGASRQPVRPIIESLTERQAYPGGPSLPMVVINTKADEAKAAWDAAMKRANQAPASIKVSIPRADGGDPVEMHLQPEHVPMRGKPVVDDDEDQDAGPIDEPPPEHNEPEAVTVGASE